MNRFEFMKQLEALLHEVSQSEREEALQYYNDYFDDAGLENEGDVIRALGTPAKVAEIIKGGLSGKTEEKYEFTDSGFKNGTEKRSNEVALSSKELQHYPEQETRKTKNKSPLAIILIILAVILLFPLWIPLVAAAFAILVSILAVAFSVLIATFAGGICILVVGIILFIVGLLNVFLVPAASLCLIGAGMILLGLGVLFLIASTWLCLKAVPAVIRAVVAICKIPFRRKEGRTA